VGAERDGDVDVEDRMLLKWMLEEKYIKASLNAEIDGIAH